MLNQSLKEMVVGRLLPSLQTPGQYVGGELNAVRKDHARLRGRLCLAFPDLYSIGMSCHGLHVLYHVMNRREDWGCERVFAPGPDMEAALRRHGLPLYSLESFTPLAQFDVLGFTLQYELCAGNVLTILDLGGIPLAAESRGDKDPLVIAGGPCVANPEPMARFIDLFVLGDGEASLPLVCDAWQEMKASGLGRAVALRRLAEKFPFVYVPRFYLPQMHEGRPAAPRPQDEGLPAIITPAVVDDLDAAPIPIAPVVPNVECVQDRIAIEIMRGCPGRCRFCQSTSLKRPLRFRSVETIIEAAQQAYAATGYNEISLLSLSSGDYPDFEHLLARLHEIFRPLGVSISVPSLRVNRNWLRLAEILTTDRHSGLTLAPEAALEEMRERIGKPVKDEDLLEGCRSAFLKGFRRVKLYFMCGLPGETEADLDGIIDLAEAISDLGRQTHGRFAKVVANVSNFVPKPHTPFQWHAMQTREYLHDAHEHLFRRRRLRSVELKCHDVETSLLEAVLCRGDRRLGEAIEQAWRRGARLDGWREHFQPDLWWQAIADAGVDIEPIAHRPYALDASLPWDHIGIHQGRCYLEQEWEKAL